MQETITFINHRRGMYCVELSDGSYTVFELLDSCEIHQKDIIKGNLNEAGSCTLFNQSEQENFEALIEDTGISLEIAKRKTLLIR